MYFLNIDITSVIIMTIMQVGRTVTEFIYHERIHCSNGQSKYLSEHFTSFHEIFHVINHE